MQVVLSPDKRLRVQTKPVKKITNGLLNTLKEMVKLTKTFKDPEGVGLAATQIGLDEAFFVARLHDSKKIPPKDPSERNKERWADYGKDFSSFINPKILSTTKKTKTYFEGCLSMPTVWGQVKRFTNIKVSYLDEQGNQITKNLTGIPAWIFQHEVDHLNGILFADRVLQQKGQFYRFKGKDQTGKDYFEEIALP